MRQCAKCGKSSKMQGARKLLRAHYNPVNWSRKYPNLQYATIEGTRMLVCTGCIRTLNKPPRKKVVKAASKAK